MKAYRTIKKDDPLGKEHIIFGDDEGNLGPALSERYEVVGEVPISKKVEKSNTQGFYNQYIYGGRNYISTTASNEPDPTILPRSILEQNYQEQLQKFEDKYLKSRLTASLVDSIKGYFDTPNGENKNEENNNDMKPKKKVSRRDIFKSNIPDTLEKVSEKSGYDAKKQQKETRKDWIGIDKKKYESTSNNSRIKEEFLSGINKMKKDGETTCYTTTLPGLYTGYAENDDGAALTGFSSMVDSNPLIRERLIFYDDAPEGEDEEKIENNNF